MPDSHTLTLAEASKLLKAQKLSHQELYQDTLQAISEDDDRFHIYLSLAEKPEVVAAKAATKPLNGAPIAVKDNFLTTDLPSTASAAILEKYQSPFESTVTTRLRQAGGVVIGKTNMDAWAHGSSTETSDFGRTLNPRNPEHLPGGSSGGSAAAVAANLCLAAIGSETAGSIRQPAAWCGVVGLKPTYGRLSRYGVVAMASSTDSPGPITKTVEDAAILFNHLAGHDPYDATTNPASAPDLTTALNQDLKGMKIGVMYHDIPGLAASWQHFEAALKVLERLGAEVELVSALDPRYAISVYTIVQRSEVSSNLARYDGIRYGQDRSHFGDEAKRRIMLGTYSLSKGYADKYYLQAQKVRTLFLEDYAQLFKQYDALVSLTSPSFAKKVGSSEGSAMFGELEDMLVEPSSIAGLPGLSVPCYQNPKTNLYLGMNIMAPMWQEEVVIRVGDAFEKATEWNEWRQS